MNVSLMRQLDEWLGPPLVRLTRLARWLEHGRPQMPPHPRRILVMKFWGLGSLVQGIPAFRALRERYPEAEVDLLTIRGNERLFAGQDLFTHVWTVDLRGFASFARDSLRRLFQVRRRDYDLILNFEGYARYGLVFSHLSGAGCVVEYRTPRTGQAEVEVEFREGRHISEVFADLTAAVDARPEVLEPWLIVPPGGRDFQETWRARYQVEADRRVVALNVNAGPISPARRWPRERFIELGQRLLARGDCRVVLVGGPDEVDYVRPVAEALGPGAINLAGQTTLAEFLGFLADVELLVTNDSGPLHLAVAMGTPTVAFFGPESPRVYGPRGRQHTALYLGLPCSPCLTFANLKRTDCDHFSCLREMTVDQAWAAVTRALDGAAAEVISPAAIRLLGAPPSELHRRGVVPDPPQKPSREASTEAPCATPGVG